MTETFPIAPTQANTSWVIILVGVIMLVALATLGYSLAGARLSRFEVSPQGLRLRGDLYGRTIPLSQLQLDDARIVDLRLASPLTPVHRIRGTAMSGYRAGWFRLSDGTRALLYVTDPSHVVYIPTVQGYSLLLSVTNPDALLGSLRRASTP